MTKLDHQTFDAIVVGYGYAGAVAALNAAAAGARVLLVEKAPTPGGISICSAGGVRIAEDADRAFAYLRETCGGKTPDAVLRRLAEGMVALPEQVKALGRVNGAKISVRKMAANYPLPGADTFGFAYVEEVPGFEPLRDYPQVRGAAAGAMLFKVLADNVAAAGDRITVATGNAVRRLSANGVGIAGVTLSDGSSVKARGGVVLACGGFEGAPDLQEQFWPGGRALNAAYSHNSGDGIRLAQSVGAGLWHMWHYHGCYGFKLPDYPYGVRVKRLPDWQPGEKRALPKMAWILLDKGGRRFMNEYEPYVQDTGARPLAHYDPVTQSYPRNPAYLVTDEAGRLLYPLGKPTRNDPGIDYEWSADNSREIASGLFKRVETPEQLADAIGADRKAVKQTVESWNAGCARGRDEAFGRPPDSLHALLQPPFYVAEVWQLVSNTQGGPVHDAEQRVLSADGEPIPGLYAAGECGSVFGHLYMSGGNLAECFVGGRVAGLNVAKRSQGEA